VLHRPPIAVSRHPLAGCHRAISPASARSARPCHANALLEQQRFEAAESLCNELVEEYPDLPAGYEGLARCAAKTEDWLLAETRWRDVVERFPHHCLALEQVGEALRMQRRFDEAEVTFRNLIDQYPERPGDYASLARCAAAAADWPLAESRWRSIVEQFPKFIPGLQGLGSALRGQGCFDEATDVFQHLRQGFPYHPHGLIGLANLSTDTRDTGAAVEIWRQAATRFPNRLDVRLGELSALFGHNDRDEARSLLTELLNNFNMREAEIWQTYLKAADSYGIEFGEIEDTYQKISRLTPQPSVDVIRIYAKALRHDNRIEEAIALIRSELVRCLSNSHNRAIKLNCALAHNLLFANRLHEASQVVDDLCALPHIDGHAGVTDLVMWKSSRDNDIETAKRLFFNSPQILKKHSFRLPDPIWS
jgi:tetratricopeptide (TPR) repeat protein